LAPIRFATWDGWGPLDGNAECDSQGHERGDFAGDEWNGRTIIYIKRNLTCIAFLNSSMDPHVNAALRGTGGVTVLNHTVEVLRLLRKQNASDQKLAKAVRTASPTSDEADFS